MVTNSILLVFIGCLIFYKTSQKAILSNKYFIEKWIQKHAKNSKFIGSLILIIALLLIINNFGLTSGIVFWLIAIMFILSLVILISPLQKINYKHCIFIFFILFVVEIFY